MLYNQIVCGSCGNRLHSSLLADSLETNKMLVDAIKLELTVNKSSLLTEALGSVPKEVMNIITPKEVPL